MQGLCNVADLVCLQETLIEPKVSRSVAAEAATLKLRFYQGVPAQVRRDALGRLQPCRGQGLAVISRQHVHWSGLWKEFGVTSRATWSRIHSARVIVDSLSFLVHNIYLPTNVSEATQLQGTEVLEEALRRISCADTTAQMLVGDFQQCPENIPLVQALLDSGWFSSSEWPGVSGCPTNRAVNGVSRQLDAILMSPQLASLVTECKIVPIFGMNSHDSVVVVLDLPTGREQEETVLLPPFRMMTWKEFCVRLTLGGTLRGDFLRIKGSLALLRFCALGFVKQVSRMPRD